MSGWSLLAESVPQSSHQLKVWYGSFNQGYHNWVWSPSSIFREGDLETAICYSRVPATAKSPTIVWQLLTSHPALLEKLVQRNKSVSLNYSCQKLFCSVYRRCSSGHCLRWCPKRSEWWQRLYHLLGGPPWFHGLGSTVLVFRSASTEGLGFVPSLLAGDRHLVGIRQEVAHQLPGVEGLMSPGIQAFVPILGGRIVGVMVTQQLSPTYVTKDEQNLNLCIIWQQRCYIQKPVMLETAKVHTREEEDHD